MSYDIVLVRRGTPWSAVDAVLQAPTWAGNSGMPIDLQSDIVMLIELLSSRFPQVEEPWAVSPLHDQIVTGDILYVSLTWSGALEAAQEVVHMAERFGFDAYDPDGDPL